MTAAPIVVALDIGTAHTTALVAAVLGDARSPRLQVLGLADVRTQGLRRGVVSNTKKPNNLRPPRMKCCFGVHF